jgi:mutator protein MutT
LKWECPGGKVEPGETYEDGLRRELREELGIAARIGPEAYRTRHDYPGKYTVALVFYHVVDFSGKLQNYAFEQICWALPADLPTYDFLEGDAELIALLSQGQLPLLQSQP